MAKSMAVPESFDTPRQRLNAALAAARRHLLTHANFASCFDLRPGQPGLFSPVRRRSTG